MDEYVGRISVNYMTNESLLKFGLEKLRILQENPGHMAPGACTRPCCCPQVRNEYPSPAAAQAPITGMMPTR